MKIVKFESKISKSFPVDGNLALKEVLNNTVLQTYEKPVVKQLVLKPQKKKNVRIFMGCYSYSWPANDGDGC